MTSIFRRKGRKGVTLKYRDAKGRDRFKTFPTRKAAEDHALDLRRRPDPGERITLKDYVATWLRHAEARVRPATHVQYVHIAEKHIVPGIGHLELTAITRPILKDLVASLKTEKGRPLGRRTAANVHGVLHGILAEAVDDGYLYANPAHGRARLGITREERARKIKAFDRGQLRKFLDGADRALGRQWALFFRVLALTGLRIGEGVALMWGDFDPARRVLHVERGRSRKIIAATKTPASIGDVDVPVGLCRDLLDWDRATKEAALASGRPRAKWIFPSRNGTPWHQSPVEKTFKVVLAAAGLPQHFTPHCLRHTFASQHLVDGASIYYVQRQLRHASIKHTVDIYGQWLPAGNLELADRLEARLRGDMSPRSNDVSPDLSLEHAADAVVSIETGRRTGDN